MRSSEAGYLSRIVLAHAPRQASVSLIFDVRQNMKIFGTEADLVSVLLEIEASLDRAAEGSSAEFREHYLRAWHLYGTHALDGHESDDTERSLLAKYSERISRIEIALESAGGICSEDDAMREIYQKAGRYGANEAIRLLRNTWIRNENGA
jgi:hypothetical protein